MHRHDSPFVRYSQAGDNLSNSSQSRIETCASRACRLKKQSQWQVMTFKLRIISHILHLESSSTWHQGHITIKQDILAATKGCTIPFLHQSRHVGPKYDARDVYRFQELSCSKMFVSGLCVQTCCLLHQWIPSLLRIFQLEMRCICIPIVAVSYMHTLKLLHIVYCKELTFNSCNGLKAVEW